MGKKAYVFSVSPSSITLTRGPTFETSALQLFTPANSRYDSVDNVKLPCYTLPPTRHQFLQKPPPLLSPIMLRGDSDKGLSKLPSVYANEIARVLNEQQRLRR